LFPAGEGATRVSQRLALMDSKEKAAFDQAKAASAQTIQLGTPSAVSTTVPTVVLKGSNAPTSADAIIVEDPDAWRISSSRLRFRKGWEKENIYHVKNIELRV
jgi:hypothetical protein